MLGVCAAFLCLTWQATAPTASSPLDAILQPVDAEANLEISVHVELLDGTVLYDFQGQDKKRLASNNKLFTTAAALLALGPEYHWHTQVFLDEDVLQIVGGGDPSLRRLGERDAGAEFLDALVQRLRARGVTELSRLEVDFHYFSPPSRHPQWPQDQLQQVYCAPLSAFSVAGGCVEVVRESGKVFLQPLVGAGMRWHFSKSKGKQFSAWWGSQSQQLVVAAGQDSRDQKLRLAVQDPYLFSMAWLQTGLQQRGISVQNVDSSQLHEQVGPLLLNWESVWSLAEVLVVTNKKSDNFLAETLFLTLGQEQFGQGDFAHGAQAVKQVLTEQFAHTWSFSQADGSGLARSSHTDLNTATAQELCLLLREMAERPQGALFFDTLPVAGVEGRLAQRFTEPIFQPQRVHAKTGFIRGASSLSGYLLLPDGQVAVFSFLVNFDPAKNKNTNNRRFKRLQEDFLAALLRLSS